MDHPELLPRRARVRPSVVVLLLFFRGVQRLLYEVRKLLTPFVQDVAALTRPGTSTRRVLTCTPQQNLPSGARCTRRLGLLPAFEWYLCIDGVFLGRLCARISPMRRSARLGAVRVIKVGARSGCAALRAARQRVKTGAVRVFLGAFGVVHKLDDGVCGANCAARRCPGAQFQDEHHPLDGRPGQMRRTSRDSARPSSLTKTAAPTSTSTSASETRGTSSSTRSSARHRGEEGFGRLRVGIRYRQQCPTW
jgi:hypothetical protein